MNTTNQTYQPAWWLPNPHLQTLYPFLFKKHHDISFITEVFELPDGDFIESIWTSKHNAPTIILLHGLQGSVNSHYINSLLYRIQTETSWNACVLHFRGCSGELNRLERQYHSGDTEDVRFICHLIKQRHPKMPIALVGFSLGGNILLKLFGELKQANLAETGIAICPPFDLHQTALSIQNGLGKLYEQMFLNDIKKLYGKKVRSGRASEALLKELNDISSLIDLDRRVTAPLHGFDSLEEYYTDSSSYNYLPMIKKPTLVIAAKNDPIINYHKIPADHEISPFVQMEIYDEGGHIGFMSGPPHAPYYWLDERILSHLASYMPLDILEIS
ncbi:hydrolase [Gammaproteobacteria bacterium]|nr:hydrolase [Gammaproteobacteria bacterium]